MNLIPLRATTTISARHVGKIKNRDHLSNCPPSQWNIRFVRSFFFVQTNFVYNIQKSKCRVLICQPPVCYLPNDEY